MGKGKGVEKGGRLLNFLWTQNKCKSGESCTCPSYIKIEEHCVSTLLLKWRKSNCENKRCFGTLFFKVFYMGFVSVVISVWYNENLCPQLWLAWFKFFGRAVRPDFETKTVAILFRNSAYPSGA